MYRLRSLVLTLILVLALLCVTAYGVEVYLAYDKSTSTVKLVIVGSPGQKVDLTVILHGEIPVTSDRVELYLRGLRIPSGMNHITAYAEGVREICPYIFFGAWVKLPCIQSTRISRSNIPAGTYDILLVLIPKPGVTKIVYSVEAYFRVTLGSNGRFETSYSVANLHLKYIEVTCNGIKKKLVLAKTGKVTKSKRKASSTVGGSVPASTPSSLEGEKHNVEVEKHKVSSVSPYRESTPKLEFFKVSTQGKIVHVCVRVEKSGRAIAHVYVKLCLNDTCIRSKTNVSGVVCESFKVNKSGRYVIKAYTEHVSASTYVNITIPTPRVYLNVTGSKINMKLVNVSIGDVITVYINDTPRFKFRVNKTGIVNITLPRLNVTGNVTIRVVVNNETVFTKSISVKSEATEVRTLATSPQRQKHRQVFVERSYGYIVEIIKEVLPEPIIDLVKFILRLFALV